MRRGGERFWQALSWPARKEDLGAVGLLLIHDARVFELLDQRLLALVVGITHLKNFLARIHIPLDAQSRPGEVQQVLHRNEIDESVSNVTAVLEIHSQIHKVNSPRAHLRNEGHQVLVAHLIRNVLDHHCSPRVQSLFYLIQIELVLLRDRRRWSAGRPDM